MARAARPALTPPTYTIAAILQWLISSLAIILTIPALAQSPNADDTPPFFVVLLAFAAGVPGLVSAYGVWRDQKWGRDLDHSSPRLWRAWRLCRVYSLHQPPIFG